MKPLITIVNSSSFGKHFPEHIEKLKTVGEVQKIDVPADISSSELLPQLKNTHAIIASVTPKFDAELLEQLPKLCIIARHGIGYNNVDIITAEQQQLAVTNVPHLVEQAAVAEHAVGLLLTATRQLVDASLAVKQGAWNRRSEFIGIELKDSTIGVIGFGNIGSHTAKILIHGFGSKVLAYDPYIEDSQIEALGAKPVKLQQLLEESQVICLHSSLSDTSLKMIGESEFQLMQDQVLIVNTARGELIDTPALEANLSSGKVACYATDVLEDEPIDQDHPLLAYKNVLIVPHLGGYTDFSLRGMGDSVVDSVIQVLQGQKIPEQNVFQFSGEIRKWDML